MAAEMNEQLFRQDKSFDAKAEKPITISHGDVKANNLENDGMTENEETANPKLKSPTWHLTAGTNSDHATIESDSSQLALKLDYFLKQNGLQPKSKEPTLASNAPEPLRVYVESSNSFKSMTIPIKKSFQPSVTRSISPRETEVEKTEAQKESESRTFSKDMPVTVSSCFSSSDKKIRKRNILNRSNIIKKFTLNCTCMLCCATYRDSFELQTHLVLQKHMPTENLKLRENFLYPEFECIQCNLKNCTSQHTCVKNMSEYLKVFVSIHSQCGTPLTCILCDGTPVRSVYHLMFHIVIFHGFCKLNTNEKQLHCPFCHALFKTRNSYVIECHALEVHLPELVIKKQKLMHPDGKSHQFTPRHFSCYFENRRYTPFVKEPSMQNCASTHSDLPGLIGHFFYAHYPVPKDFLPTKARPITCKACLFRFSNRTQLRDHVCSAHISYLRLRSLVLQRTDSFEDHCDPTRVCQFCWTNQNSVERLQTHILVYHVNSWRYCGFCKRELCRSQESMSPQILYRTLERHVDHHLKQLEEHFNEMAMICQLRQSPHTELGGNTTVTDDDYFKRVEINKHVKQAPSQNNLDEFLSKLKDLVKMKLDQS